MSRGDQPWEWSGRLRGAYWAMLVGQTKIAQRFFPNIKNLSYFLSPEKYLVWQSWPGFTEDQNQSGKLANFSAQTTVKEQALT